MRVISATLFFRPRNKPLKRLSPLLHGLDGAIECLIIGRLDIRGQAAAVEGDALAGQ